MHSRIGFAKEWKWEKGMKRVDGWWGWAKLGGKRRVERLREQTREHEGERESRTCTEEVMLETEAKGRTVTRLLFVAFD